MAHSMGRRLHQLQQHHLHTDHHHHLTMLCQAIHRHTRATAAHQLLAKATDKLTNQQLPANHRDSRTRRQVVLTHRLRCQQSTRAILAARLVPITLASCSPVHSALTNSSIPLLVINPQLLINLHSR